MYLRITNLECDQSCCLFSNIFEGVRNRSTTRDPIMKHSAQGEKIKESDRKCGFRRKISMQAAERGKSGRHWSGDEVDDVEEYAEGFP